MLHSNAEPAAAPLAGVSASRAFFEPCLTGGGARLLWVAHVDGATRCIHLSGHELGDGNGNLPVGEILGEAAQLGSAGLVLAQRGTGERGSPSAADVQETQRLAAAAEVLDCTLLDHLLFTSDGCRSMRRMSLL